MFSGSFNGNLDRLNYIKLWLMLYVKVKNELTEYSNQELATNYVTWDCDNSIDNRLYASG